jgi:hypothetical protein
MKKNIIICFVATISLLLMNSCAELMQVANYTASTWVQTMDNKGLSTPENTVHANAWLSGTGGKAMVAADVLTSIIGDASGKDVSGVKNIIRGSMNNIVSDPNASKNDKANLVGSLFAVAGNTANHFESKNFEKEVNAFNELNSHYTDSESSLYDPYFDCRYVIDYDKKSIRKQDDYKELAECIRGIDAAKYEEEMNELLQDYGMTYAEYSKLPITERPSIAEIVKGKETIFENEVIIPENNEVAEITKEPVVEESQTLPVVSEETQAVDDVITYRVQVLALNSPLQNKSFSGKFNNLVEEKFDIYGKTYYQYTVKGGTLKDAVKLKKELISKGVSDAWIVGYKGAQRVIPDEKIVQ